MSEKICTCSVAYRKGIQAYADHQYKRNLPKCPYGETKRELKAWWLAGYQDAEIGHIDHSVYDAGEVVSDDR